MSGHHHLVIDAPAPGEGEAIPFDATHLHFGKGQTSADVELAPVRTAGPVVAGVWPLWGQPMCYCAVHAQ